MSIAQSDVNEVEAFGADGLFVWASVPIVSSAYHNEWCPPRLPRRRPPKSLDVSTHVTVIEFINFIHFDDAHNGVGLTRLSHFNKCRCAGLRCAIKTFLPSVRG